MSNFISIEQKEKEKENKFALLYVLWSSMNLKYLIPRHTLYEIICRS